MTSSKRAVSPPRMRRTNSASSRGPTTAAIALCAIKSTSRPLIRVRSRQNVSPARPSESGDTILNSANSVWCPRISEFRHARMADSRRARVESVQGLLDFGWWLRIVAVATYAAAFVGYAARLAVRKLELDRAATGLAG